MYLDGHPQLFKDENLIARVDLRLCSGQHEVRSRFFGVTRCGYLRILPALMGLQDGHAAQGSRPGSEPLYAIAGAENMSYQSLPRQLIVAMR